MLPVAAATTCKLLLEIYVWYGTCISFLYEPRSGFPNYNLTTPHREDTPCPSSEDAFWVYPWEPSSVHNEMHCRSSVAGFAYLCSLYPGSLFSKHRITETK